MKVIVPQQNCARAAVLGAVAGEDRAAVCSCRRWRCTTRGRPVPLTVDAAVLARRRRSSSRRRRRLRDMSGGGARSPASLMSVALDACRRRSRRHREQEAQDRTSDRSGAWRASITRRARQRSRSSSGIHRDLMQYTRCVERSLLLAAQELVARAPRQDEAVGVGHVALVGVEAAQRVVARAAAGLVVGLGQRQLVAEALAR